MGLGWSAKTRILPCLLEWQASLRCAAHAFWWVAHIQYSVKQSVHSDRMYMLHDLAHQTQVHAHSNDFKSAFRIVRGLTGFCPESLKTVFMKSGSLSRTDEQRQVRWQQHFAELFQGDVIDSPDDLAYLPPPLAHPTSFEIDRITSDWSIDKLSSGEGLGPDGLAGEVLKAGG